MRVNAYAFLVVIIWILLINLLVAFVHELINYMIITYYGASASMHFGFFKLSCSSLAFYPLPCDKYMYAIAYTQVTSYNNITNETYNQIMHFVGINENIFVQVSEAVLIALLLAPIFYKLLDIAFGLNLRKNHLKQKL